MPHLFGVECFYIKNTSNYIYCSDVLKPCLISNKISIRVPKPATSTSAEAWKSIWMRSWHDGEGMGWKFEFKYLMEKKDKRRDGEEERGKWKLNSKKHLPLNIRRPVAFNQFQGRVLLKKYFDTKPCIAFFSNAIQLAGGGKSNWAITQISQPTFEIRFMPGGVKKKKITLFHSNSLEFESMVEVPDFFNTVRWFPFFVDSCLVLSWDAHSHSLNSRFGVAILCSRLSPYQSNIWCSIIFGPYLSWFMKCK